MKRGVQKERNKKVSVNVNLAVGNIFGQCSSFLALAIKLKGAVSRRNSAKLGNYKMPVKLRET